MMTSHLCFYFSHNSAPDSDTWQYVAQNEATAITQADHVSTVSHAYADSLESLFMLPEGGISVIGNGIDLKPLDRTHYDQYLRNDLLGGHKKLAVFVGRLVPTKGVELVLDAAEALPDWSFVMFASICASLEAVAPLAKRIKRLTNELPNLTWFNKVQDDKLSAMKCADVGLVPSLHEPFGIVGLEWMGLETPLLTTAYNGLADFCTEDNCFIHEATSESLIKSLQNFKPDPNKVTAGRETAESHTWRRTADLILADYEKVVPVGCH